MTELMSSHAVVVSNLLDFVSSHFYYFIDTVFVRVLLFTCVYSVCYISQINTVQYK